MKNTIAGLSLLVSGCHTIHPQILPQYDNHGDEIAFLEERNNPHGASSKYIKGVPTIKYDPFWMGQFPEEFQQFIFYHEVAHFKRGDLNNWGPYLGGGELDEMQREADCDSLLYLRDTFHYTPRQFATIYEFASLYLDQKRADDMIICLTHK